MEYGNIYNADILVDGDYTKLDTVFSWTVEYVFNLLSYHKAKIEMQQEQNNNGK